ncbi:hypothetical protein SUDANB95_03200 [Actinosynnema sp. ALI-1.44]
MRPNPPSPLPARTGPGMNPAASVVAGGLALVTAAMLVWFALANVVHADATARAWSGLTVQNVVGGLGAATVLLVAAGFTVARRIAGAWALCGLCVLYVVVTTFVAPLLRGASLDAHLRFLFGFGGSDDAAIGLAVIFSVFTATAAAVAASLR